jgi:archaellum component FlaG (FlaF/FlaG flagellin family)
VVSRDELTARELAELAALDRILDREPVGEEHLELAALVDSVRAGAPRMDPEFAARLDAQIAGRVTRKRRLPVARPSMRRLTLAGGGVVAAAVALTIVISSGVLNGGTNVPNLSPPPSTGSQFATPKSSTPNAAERRHTLAPTGATPAVGPAAVSGSTALAHPPSAVDGASAQGGAAQPRLVQRGSTLTLASSAATMQAVANQIVVATEQQGGVVQSSDVNIQGPSSYASFSLRVPSGRLAPLIANLSALASVRALTQSTVDITDGYNQETARLADSIAERAALLKKLATVATSAEATTIQQQIDALGHRIAAEHRAISVLLNEGHTATLQVNVVRGASATHSSTAGPLSSAFHKALHALEEILAIALIALAIVLPFALSALAVWWAGASLRQRARERAIKTA